MDLKTLLGAAYKDNMTLADVELALADRELLDKSEVDNIVATRTAAQKRLLDAANKKVAEANQRNTAVGNENAELLERITALETAKKESDRNAGIAATKASLLAQGYDEALASDTAIAMADNNMAKILENQGKFLASKTQAIKDELLNGTKPPAGGGSGSGGVDYNALKNQALKDGNDLEYLRLCREESEQTSEK